MKICSSYKTYSKPASPPRLKTTFYSTKEHLYPRTALISPFFTTKGLQISEWSLPQRIEPSNPLSKTLIKTREKISAEAKIEKKIRNKSPGVDFFRQTYRTIFPESKYKVNRKKWIQERPQIIRKVVKKVVVIGENDVKKIEVVMRKIYSKSALRNFNKGEN
ncbi:hypothetical protein SteCoe_22691 [Stentor coeruleus]|uniref:Uncharacterized protein n=1 Tax=Stentor coeruleus TaxID=5963 RepID=A0A1R2BLE4_9CILI|nr:hypothetical protein SteCoe_22691 [Stentor coeruleus]